MRQLEPVGDKRPIYEENCPKFKDWVNYFINLDCMHRFSDDPKWGCILRCFCMGECTEEDIDRINEQVVTPYTVLPEDICYATYFNWDHDAINAALFEEHCKHLYKIAGDTSDTIIMIFSDNIMAENGSKTYVPFKNSTTFWENCGENDAVTPRQASRMDPVLKLYHWCRLMLPCNKNVEQVQANGTQVTLKKVVLKAGVTPQVVCIGENIPYKAVCASKVAHIVVKHCNDRVQLREFSLQPKKYTFKGKLPKPITLQEKKGTVI
jgi:hypothetical protein